MVRGRAGIRGEDKRRGLKDRTRPTLLKVLARLGHVKGKFPLPTLSSSESFMNQERQDSKSEAVV